MNSQYTPAEKLEALRPTLAQLLADLHAVLVNGERRAQQIDDLLALIDAVPRPDLASPGTTLVTGKTVTAQEAAYATARLMASASDLLAACEHLASVLEHWDPTVALNRDDLLIEVYAAIDKAKGKQ